MLDGAQSLSRDPGVIERVAAATELLDSAVANIRRAVFDLEDHGMPQPEGATALALVRCESEMPHADSTGELAVNGNSAPTDPLPSTVLAGRRQMSTRVRGGQSA